MAKDDDHDIQPLIIKRINKIAAGHHGGAWKVAYADFVTAMMAFFLLLWLLATTTPEQREGIAEYFTPTVGLKDSKGIGFEGGLTPNEKGTSRTTLAAPGLVAGQVPQGPRPEPPENTEAKSDDAQSAAGAIMMPEGAKSDRSQDNSDAAKESKAQEEMKKLQQQVMQALDESSELEQLRKNIIVTNTPEGVRLDVIDDPANPLFVTGTAVMTDTGRKMFGALSNMITKTRNQISIAGHTESAAFPPGAIYTGWELSTDRANATRRFMTESMHDPKRVAKVMGMADRDLLLPKEPQNPRNRRISLTLLRDAQMVDPKDAPSGRDLLSVPEVDANKIVHKKPAPPPRPPAESPEAKPSPIFMQGGAKPQDQAASPANGGKGGSDASSDPGLGFVVPKGVPSVPLAPPPPAKPVVEQAPPPASPATPVQAPAPDSLFAPQPDAPNNKGFKVPE